MQLIDGARPNKTPWNSWRQDYVHSTIKYSCFFWIKPIITSVFIISTSSTSVPNLKILLFAFINLQDSVFFFFYFLRREVRVNGHLLRSEDIFDSSQRYSGWNKINTIKKTHCNQKKTNICPHPHSKMKNKNYCWNQKWRWIKRVKSGTLFSMVTSVR